MEAFTCLEEGLRKRIAFEKIWSERKNRLKGGIEYSWNVWGFERAGDSSSNKEFRIRT